MASANILNKFSMDFFSLKGKAAIVAGGNTGLGQAYAVALAKAGADLVIPTYDKEWEETRELIEKEGRTVIFVQADLTKKEDIQNIVNITMSLFGKVDILINSEEIIKKSTLSEYREEEQDAIMDINLNTVYYFSHEVAKIMVKQGFGKIINVAPMSGYHKHESVHLCTVSKHGVMGITKAFANELAAKNIQINAIAPGCIETLKNELISSDKKGNSNVQVELFDVMGAVVFLASKASDYINGQILEVDGGLLNKIV